MIAMNDGFPDEIGRNLHDVVFQSLYLQQKHIANHPTGRITVDLFNQPCCSKLPVFTNQFNDALRILPAFLSYDLFDHIFVRTVSFGLILI